MILLIGQPNVGKSTLFNRLIGRKEAIVSRFAGTTVNLKQSVFDWNGRSYAIADIAGLPFDKSLPHYQSVVSQVDEAMRKASLFFLVIDGSEGLTHIDHELLAMMRKYAKPIALIVNKIDPSSEREVEVTMNISPIFYISALHGIGLNGLLDFIESREQPIALKVGIEKIAVIGRQNVGKSTLFNALTEKESSVISAVAGTTRDPIEEPLLLHGNQFTLIDTAGIRKRGKVSDFIEKISVSKSYDAINASGKVICMVDGQEGPTRQDVHLIDYASRKRKPVLIVVNKWDIVEPSKQDLKTAVDDARRLYVQRFPFLNKFDIIPVSALTKWNLLRVKAWLVANSHTTDA